MKRRRNHTTRKRNINAIIRFLLACLIAWVILQNINLIRLGEKVGNQNDYSPQVKNDPPGSISSSWNCTPTHHACDDYQGVLQIAYGDYGGAGGTIFFQFIIGQLIYAEQHQLLPFIHLNNFSYLVNDAKVHGSDQQPPTATLQAMSGLQISTIQDYRMRKALYPGPLVQEGPSKAISIPLYGTGVWNHYFHPVSDYCPGDQSCAAKPLVQMNLPQVSPGLHLFAPWAPKIWRYGPMPHHMAQPHLPLHQWLLPQRQVASDIVQRYYRFQPLISRQVNPNITRHCIGVHIRWSDKGGTRRRLDLHEFVPYLQAYLQARHTEPTCIYLATDSVPVLERIRQTWPTTIQSQLILSTSQVRSPDETAVFDMESHHITNQEVLRDILELSQCGFLLHGKSAVSESAIYLNPDLIYQSVNLEDPTHVNATAFGELVRQVTMGKIDSNYWKDVYQPPREWWEKDANVRPCQALNVTLELTLATGSMSIHRWTRKIFEEFPQLLASGNPVVLDPLWCTWIQRDSSLYQLSALPTSLTTTLRRENVEPETLRSLPMKPVWDELLVLQPHIVQQATNVFPVTEPSRCLGVYIQDPGYRRQNGEWTQQRYRQIQYHSYIDAYRQAGGTCVYLATDSFALWEEFYGYANATNGSTFVWYSQADAVRNREQVPAHYMEERMQRLGSETLVDIWNLHRCGILVHGSSPVSEAALSWNPDLPNVRVQDRVDLTNFTSVIRSTL